MNFIEHIFHVAPDGGNGMTELAFLIAFFSAIGLVVWLRLARHERTRGN